MIEIDVSRTPMREILFRFAHEIEQGTFALKGTCDGTVIAVIPEPSFWSAFGIRQVQI